MSKSRPIRADKKFKKLLEEVRLDRLRRGKNKNSRELSDRRLTEAIANIPKLKDILKKADISGRRREIEWIIKEV